MFGVWFGVLMFGVLWALGLMLIRCSCCGGFASVCLFGCFVGCFTIFVVCLWCCGAGFVWLGFVGWFAALVACVLLVWVGWWLVLVVFALFGLPYVW